MTDPKPKKPARPRKAAPTADTLRRTAAQVTEGLRGPLPTLIERLQADHGLTLRDDNIAGVKATMLGITARSTAGRHMALANWANAARRKANVLEG